MEKTLTSKYSNLTVKEKKALQELQSRNDVLTTGPNKGEAIVILDVEDYIKEAERQFNNKGNYKK